MKGRYSIGSERKRDRGRDWGENKTVVESIGLIGPATKFDGSSLKIGMRVAFKKETAQIKTCLIYVWIVEGHLEEEEIKTIHEEEGVKHLRLSERPRRKGDKTGVNGQRNQGRNVKKQINGGNLPEETLLER